ncbi:MAG TPA: PQQ-binding-like beta-propeller repeat protein [Jatrophihabitantaceae bacterium]
MRAPIVAAAVLALTAAGLTISQPAGAASTDWTQYHGSADRAGYARSMPVPTGRLRVIKRIRLDGAVYASPIVAAGLTIVATEHNTVYAFNARNHLVWRRHLGRPSPARQRPCGNIDPLGITGTPLYRNGLVYVAAELSGRPPTHRLFGLRVGTGRVRVSRSLDRAGVARAAMQERGALAYAAGRVWVPFGGLAGDCGHYKGRLVGFALSGKGKPRVFTVPTAREAGIWTPPGPSVDRAGNLYVSVGNGASGVGDRYDHSDSVLKINGRGHRIDSFSPTTWPTDNDHDLDLGSQGPALVGRWVFIAGKSGTAYVLRQSHLGGIGGQVRKRALCRSFGGTAVRGSVVYVPCTDGVRAVRIGPHGGMHVLWHARSSVTGSPVIGGRRLWTLDTGAGVLHALGLYHGISRGSVAVGAVSRFATPALSGRRILIGTLTGLTVVRI